MSTATEEYIEFRCGTCYQLRHESTESSGTEKECPYCHAATTVPEVTPDRIRQAHEIESLADSAVQPGMYADAPLSTDEVNELARQRVAEGLKTDVSSGVVSVDSLSCDRWKRIVAHLADGFFALLAVLGNLLVGHMLSTVGLCKPLEIFFQEGNQDFNGMVCYFGLVFIYQVIVWWSIAMHGVSPGKFLLSIQIVNGQGQYPGFVRGVIMRYWVAGFVLSVIPFAGFANLISFFVGEPPRCIHDYIAGTWVVDRL